MTADDFAKDVVDHLPGKPRFDPITIAILLGIISAVVSHFVQKCLNRIDPAQVRAPGWLRRAQLHGRLSAEFRRRAPELSREWLMPMYSTVLARAATLGDEHVLGIAGSVAPKV